MVNVNVKWGKQSFVIDVDTSAPVEVFKSQLQSLTNVPASKQKIMGVKGGQLKDDANLSDLGLKEGQQLMLIGSADAAIAAPQAQIVFSEDHKGTSADLATSNGLINLANTCYLNAALQVLRTIPQIRPLLNRGPALNKAVGSLFNELDATKDPVKPVGVWAALMAQFPEFARTSEQGFPTQHDSQEALAGILNNVLEVIRGDPGLASNMGKLASGKLIQTRSKENSESPDSVSTSINDFSILTVNLAPGQATLEMNIQSTLKGTMTVPSEGQEIVYNTSSKFSELPEYLFVHLARFTWRKDTKSKPKILAQINIPFILDLNSFCTDELKAKMEAERSTLKERRDKEVERRKRAKNRTNHDDDDDNSTELPKDTEPSVLGNTNGYYELCGVVSHKGRDTDGGHYVAWAKKKGAWLVFDDSNVAPVTEQNISDLSGGPPEAHMAYILLYRSRDPTTFSPPLNL